MDKQRVYSIEILRLIFSVLIILFHMQQQYSAYGLFSHGNIGVSFFFVLSGWFLAHHIEKRNNGDLGLGKETFLYTMHKASVFYLPFVICWIGTYVYLNCVVHNSFKIWIINFVNSLPELLLLRSSGLNTLSYIPQAWYLSAMLLSIMIIYPLLARFRDLYKYAISPLLCIFLFGFMSYQTGMLRDVDQQFYIFQKSLLWAMAVMNMGVFMQGLSKLIVEKIHTKNWIRLIGLIKLILLSIILLYAISPYGTNSWEFVISIFIGLFVMLEMSFPTHVGKNAELHTLYSRIGEYSLYIYLIHYTVMIYWNLKLGSYNVDSMHIRYWGYVLLTLIAAIIVMLITVVLRKLLKSTVQFMSR